MIDQIKNYKKMNLFNEEKIPEIKNFTLMSDGSIEEDIQ